MYCQSNLLFVVSFTAFAASAHGGVTVYDHTQRELWFQDVGGEANVSTVDFTGQPKGTPITDQWAHLGIQFAPSHGFLQVVGESPTTFPRDGWGLRAEPDILLRFDEPITFIAADFPGNISIELYVNDQLYFDTGQLGIGGTDNFGGLISDVPFDRARIYDPQDNLAFLDDLHFGPPIPAPGVLAPFGLILLTHKRRGRTS